jgi:hypothetical protein
VLEPAKGRSLMSVGGSLWENAATDNVVVIFSLTKHSYLHISYLGVRIVTGSRTSYVR